MPRQPSSALSRIPSRSREAWILALVVAAAGVVVGAFYCGSIGRALPESGRSLTLLSLKPCFDLRWINVIVSWMAPAFESPLVSSAILGFAAGVLVLFCDAVIRRLFLAANPGAAALAAVMILLAASWGGVLRLEGHWGVLAGAALAPLGCLLVLEGQGRAAWIGAGLAATAAALHPAWLGAILVVAACGAGRVALVEVVLAASLVGLGVLFRSAGSGPALAVVDRARFALGDLAAAPILAFSPWPRFDVPTGFEALTSSAPVIAGLAVHAVLLGAGMMIGGIRAGLVVAGSAVVSVGAAAFLVPGYIPGDRAFVLPVMIGYAPLVALALSAIPERIAKAGFPGVILGACVVGVLLASDRAPTWTTIGAALDLPHEREAAGSILAIHLEKDPARLVLFLAHLGLTDAYSPALVEAADKLLDGGAPALFPAKLKEILDQKMSRAGRRRKDPEFERLAAEVSKELSLAERLWGQGAARNFEGVADALLQVHTKVLDLNFNWRFEFESVKAVQNFRKLAGFIIPVASRAAYYEYSLPMLEAVQRVGPETPETAATIAIQKVFAGDPDGRGELEAVLSRLPAKTPFEGITRGVFGMTLLAQGDPAAALKELQAAWNVIGKGGVKNVALSVLADTTDYYVVAEILLARYEAARKADPALAAQAARDLEDLLRPSLMFGPRRVPALGIMGRFQLLLGERQKALELLREARQIPSKTLEDRSDGPIGRVAHPRYRRLVLENLLLALGDDAGGAREKEEVAAELAQLQGK